MAWSIGLVAVFAPLAVHRIGEPANV